MDPQRRLRLSLALLAAVLHLAVPVGAYAKAPAAGGLGDFCSATRGAALFRAQGGLPSPLSNEHHCAYAPCCSGGATGAAAPAPATPAILWAAVSHPRPVSGQFGSARATVIAAAQARGPPLVH
jgi:hypothetical protein